MVWCNTSGGKKKHPIHRSIAKKDAHKIQRARGTAKEVVRKQDRSRNTFGGLKEGYNDAGLVLPKSAKVLKKGEHEKIPGTRIQNGAGGMPMRIVVESGKAFPPKSVFACKQHMLKLAKERKEAEEIARMRGDDLPEASIKADEILQEAESRKDRRLKRKQADKEPPAAPLSKKERKMQQREANQRKLEDMRKECLAGGERELLTDGWHTVEVVAREKGFAWVRLSAASTQSLSDEARQKIREASGAEVAPAGTGAADAAADADAAAGEKVRLYFFDVAEQGLNLKPGAKLCIQLHRDAKGAGACNAKSAATSATAALPGTASETLSVSTGTSALVEASAALEAAQPDGDAAGGKPDGDAAGGKPAAKLDTVDASAGQAAGAIQSDAPSSS